MHIPGQRNTQDVLDRALVAIRMPIAIGVLGLICDVVEEAHPSDNVQFVPCGTHVALITKADLAAVDAEGAHT